MNQFEEILEAAHAETVKAKEKANANIRKSIREQLKKLGCHDNLIEDMKGPYCTVRIFGKERVFELDEKGFLVLQTGHQGQYKLVAIFGIDDIYDHCKGE